MIKTLLIILTLAVSGLAYAGSYSQTGQVSVFSDGPSAAPYTVWLNTYNGQSIPSGIVKGQWTTIDLSAKLPVGTKALHATGILIITHGTTVETCDLTVSFRDYGSSATPSYIGQATEAHVGGGQRTNMAAWIPVSNGKFDFKYDYNTTGTWPTHCSYGVSLMADAIVK